MTVTVYVPRDTTALALGADDVAALIEQQAKRRELDLKLVRNGSRGLFWLEPMVEVETAQGRVAYGPVEPDDVAGLVEAGLFDGGAEHPLARGLTDEIPYLKRQ